MHCLVKIQHQSLWILTQNLLLEKKANRYMITMQRYFMKDARNNNQFSTLPYFSSKGDWMPEFNDNIAVRTRFFDEYLLDQLSSGAGKKRVCFITQLL